MATTPFNSTAVIVDDTDPALTYSRNWITGGSAYELGGTTHGSMMNGASVQFKFRGTSVAVYGTVGIDTPRSSYALDGSSPSIYAAEKSKETVYRNLFFQSPTLSDEEHTLVITNLGTGQVWIDYLLYTPSAPPQSVSSSTSSSLTPSSTITPTPSKTSTVNSTTPKPSSTSGPGTGLPGQANSNTPGSKSSIPIPAVVGAAIGALILIIALVFGMLYYRKRAKRLAGTKVLEKKDIFGDSSELGKAAPSVAVTPFTSAYSPNPHTSSGHGNSTTNVYPPSSAYPSSDYGYPDRSQPSTPIYHFSNNYALQSGYDTSSDHIVAAAAGPGYGEMDRSGSQYGGTQYEYAGSIGHLQNPHSQYGGVQQQTYDSSDRLAVPQRQGSIGSAESHASLAYLSSDRVAMDPYSPLPDALPGPPPTQATLQQTEKGGLIVHNDSTPELRQHEDGGVRLDVQRPQGPTSQPQQVIDLPPVYKPEY